jgi:2-keto-4-pentenoate hydratase/2-oxohepta-3-ene-1,7-dioic acid hydratase in catechol pathway
LSSDTDSQVQGADIDLPMGKVLCVGRNYLSHIHELGNTKPNSHYY